MEGYVTALWTVVTLVVLCTVQCHGDMVSVINRVENLNREILRLKQDVVGVGENVLDQIDLAKISLRSELKQHISEHVREAIAGILQGESIGEMVRSQVITEVRQLKRGNHVMKRQLHHVLISISDVRVEMNAYKKALEKAKRDASELKVCTKYVVDNEILKRDLKQCTVRNIECKRDINEFKQHAGQKDKDILEIKKSLEKMNQTYQLHVRELNTSTATTQGVTSSPEWTTISTPVPISLATTPKPEEERSRMIIAPLWYPTQKQFRQLKIHSNTVSTYQLRSLKHVYSVTYVSKLRKLLVGLYHPNKIISSNLDSNEFSVMRENILTSGMAVDEGREIVFLTTYQPRYTISRMTTQGKDFTAITYLSSYGRDPLAITVNSKEKKIYACNYGKVFMVTYDGRVLQTLATGSKMHAVTLDNTGSTLYYSNDKILMKRSLSRNVTEVVTTLDVTPWNIKYYKDTIYYSSYRAYKVGAVDVGYNVVSYTLQTLDKTGNNAHAICLVP